MGEHQDVALRRVIVAVLVVLNMSVICFYGLWQVADTIAVNRAEAVSYTHLTLPTTPYV